MEKRRTNFKESEVNLFCGKKKSVCLVCRSAYYSTYQVFLVYNTKYYAFNINKILSIDL